MFLKKSEKEKPFEIVINDFDANLSYKSHVTFESCLMWMKKKKKMKHLKCFTYLNGICFFFALVAFYHISNVRHLHLLLNEECWDKHLVSVVWHDKQVCLLKQIWKKKEKYSNVYNTQSLAPIGEYMQQQQWTNQHKYSNNSQYTHSVVMCSLLLLFYIQQYHRNRYYNRPNSLFLNVILQIKRISSYLIISFLGFI